MKGQRGFTLIEAMVAGVISVIIPGVVITLLRVSNTELAANSDQLRLTQISNLVSEDFQRNAASATWVFGSSEVVLANACPGGVPTALDQSGVVFCDAARAIIKGFRVAAVGGGIGKLEECIPAWGACNPAGNGWRTFTIGADTVMVDMNPNGYTTKSGGVFGLLPNGQFTWFNFRYRMTFAGVSSTLSMQTESVICRNAASHL
ncbi:MAG TPA: type II secretion system protein [Fibrobacteria bacterium]|nr:type II secretion system protein [Fibrobacteria bacterium]